MQVIQPSISGQSRRFAIAVSRFNELVTERLLQGATATLSAHGVAAPDQVVVWVPGAFELPLCCQELAATGEFAAVLALGAVIRGDTDHYDHICTQAAAGLLHAGLATKVPVIFGVLTCDTLELALARAESKGVNKGSDAALAALEMAAVLAAIRKL